MLRRWGGIRTSAVVVDTLSHGAGTFAFTTEKPQKLLVVLAGTVSAMMRAATFFARRRCSAHTFLASRVLPQLLRRAKIC